MSVHFEDGKNFLILSLSCFLALSLKLFSSLYILPSLFKGQLCYTEHLLPSYRGYLDNSKTWLVTQIVQAMMTLRIHLTQMTHNLRMKDTQAVTACLCLPFITQGDDPTQSPGILVSDNFHKQEILCIYPKFVPMIMFSQCAFHGYR